MVNTGANVKWNGNYIFGNEVLVNIPEMGSIVAATIAGWAVTEANLGRTFAALVGAKQPVTMSMYMAIRSSEAQRDLLRTAAIAVLSKRHAMLFEAAIAVIYKTAEIRHRFAHRVWGASADPNLQALLLVDPKHFWTLSVAQERAWNTKRGKNTIERLGLSEFIKRQPKLEIANIQVYKLKDLQEARDRIERAFRVSEALRQFASAKTLRRRLIYRWLCNEVDVRQALEKVKKRLATQSSNSARTTG